MLDQASARLSTNFMANIRGICFDLFNTLVNVASVPEDIGPMTADVLGLDHEIWRRACFGEQHEICSPTNALENLRRLAHSIDPTISEETIQEAVKARQRRFDHALLNIEEETLATLADLQQTGIRLALVSNASSAEVRAWPQSPLAPLFDSAIFSCHCGSKKPDPGIYQYALTQLGLAPHSCLFVGDGGSNEHMGAYAVGMKPILLRRHLQPARRQELEQELAEILTATIDSLVELDGLLDG